MTMNCDLCSAFCRFGSRRRRPEARRALACIIVGGLVSKPSRQILFPDAWLCSSLLARPVEAAQRLGTRLTLTANAGGPRG